MATLEGKFLQFGVGTEYYACQTTGSLTININTDTEDPCKPEEGDEGGIGWDEIVASSKSWTASMSAKAFADELAMNNITISELLINGDGKVALKFQTRQLTGYTHPMIFVYEGTAIITEQTINADATGSATQDVTFTGTGALTFTKTTLPVTP